MATLDLLDNPVWHALATIQAGFAQGDQAAKRFLPSVSPLSGLRESSAAAFDSLARLFSNGETVGLIEAGPITFPSGWSVLREGLLAQMVCSEPVADEQRAVERLGPADVDEMLSLVELTKPGPFARRTIELGSYIGIRNSGRLVAMAGERLRLPGFTEVSAVCTHPEHRGRGYARSLVAILTNTIQRRGDVPFLHVRQDNQGAIHVYEQLGFRTRKLMHYVVLRLT
jgi:ribosomal protein S18 acetylase RimI-like enzyme